MPALDVIQQLLEGAIAGTQMHQDLVRSQDEHDATLRQAAQQDRNNRLQDIQEQMMLNTSSRAVSPSGTVQDSPTTSLLGQMLGGDDSGQPNPMGNLPITLPGAIRKADSSRVVKYKDADGNTISRELYTPEEQNQRAATAKQQQVDAGMIDVPVPPALQDSYGGAKTIKATPGGVAGIMRDMNQLARQNETFDITPEDQKTYGVPASMKGDLYDNFLNMKSRHLADQDAAARAKVSQDAQDARADKRNTATVAAANAREDAVDKRAQNREDVQKNGQAVGVTLKKQAALNSAEAAYRTEVNRLGLNRTLKPEDKQAQIAVAQKRLRDSKQDAQNAYAEGLTALGKPVEHFEYPTVGEQQAAGQPAPAAPGGKAPAASQKFTEADVRAKATAAGKDPDAVVKAAKAKGLIQ